MDVVFLPSQTETVNDMVMQLTGAEIVAAVLGKPDDAGTQWILAPLSESIEPVQHVASERGYFLAGTLAYLPNSGRIAAAAEDDDPECTLILAAAVPAFAKHVTAKLRREQDADWTRFMRSLWN